MSRRDDYRHDNPLPEIEAARKRAPRAWALLDEIDRLIFSGDAVTGISVGEVERLVGPLTLCGRGSYGDISEELAESIRERMARVHKVPPHE